MPCLSDRVTRGPRQSGSLRQKEYRSPLSIAGSPAVVAGTGGGSATDVATAWLFGLAPASPFKHTGLTSLSSPGHY